MAKLKQELRIIGGNWKGRKLRFQNTPDLRPTPAKVRETLFNWLRPSIHGASCLDLFAGSGILGLEALSQGAGDVTWVDRNRTACQAISAHLELLGAEPDSSTVVTGSAARFLSGPARHWDIVFLDPPYTRQDLLYEAVERLISSHTFTCLYAEARDAVTLAGLADEYSLELHRTTRSGDAHGALIRKSASCSA